ncbi:MAG: hypothetical protein HRT88_11985 [Lentisphaeraceae bacterium]|nr:hypothetical protein [Lentisphaeraceae bacterium]
MQKIIGIVWNSFKVWDFSEEFETDGELIAFKKGLNLNHTYSMYHEPAKCKECDDQRTEIVIDEAECQAFWACRICEEHELIGSVDDNAADEYRLN